MKIKYSLLLLLIAFSFSAASNLALALDSAPATSSSGFSSNVSTELSKAEIFITTKTPIGGWLDALEKYRIRTLDTLKEKESALKKQINESDTEISKLNDTQAQTDVNSFQENSYVTKESGKALNTPLLRAKVFFFDILYFIYTTRWLFYLLCAFIVFLILRTIYRWIF